jgi:hypothetical protein
MPMSGMFIAFKRVQPNQYFHINGKTWIKAERTLQNNGYTYNSYEFSVALLTPTPSIHILVREFDEATLVKVDTTLPLFGGHIVLKDTGEYDNDN